MYTEDGTQEQRDRCNEFRADRRKLTSRLRDNSDQYDLLQSRLLQEQRLLDSLNRQIDRTGDPAGFQQQLTQLENRIRELRSSLRIAEAQGEQLQLELEKVDSNLWNYNCTEVS